MRRLGAAALVFGVSLAAVPTAVPGDDAPAGAAGTPRAVTLDGREVAAPEGLAPRTLLVMSFHRAANGSARGWRSALDEEARAAEWSVYTVVVLEGAPQMIRRFVVRGLRGDVPADRHGSFLVVEEGADAWRVLAGSDGEAEDQNDAVFVARLEGGKVCTRYRGLVSAAALDRLFSAPCGP